MPKLKFELYTTVQTENQKFTHLLGKPQMSYSAYGSWTTPEYRGEFIAQKFLGLKVPGGIFPDYGTAAGEFIELNGEQPDPEDEHSVTCRELLSPEDIAHLQTIVPRPEGAEYEREILLDRGHYCIIGYIDETSITDTGGLRIRDFKTGGEKKKKDYADMETYKQTNLYSHAVTLEGETVDDADVFLLDRKGNNIFKGDKNVLRLTGKFEEIPTPYDAEATEEWLDTKFDVVAKDISDYIRFFKKIFPDHGNK